jgi:DnaK suppressor protein
MTILHMLSHLNATRGLHLQDSDLTSVYPIDAAPARDGDYLVAEHRDADIWRVATFQDGRWLRGVTPVTRFWVGLDFEAHPDEAEALDAWASRTLHSMRERTLSGLRDLSGETGQDVRASGDEADLSTARAEHEARLGAQSVLKRRLLDIESAIARVKSGEYGLCKATGEEIPRARLRANPLALYTVTHQSRIEALELRGIRPRQNEVSMHV